MAEEWESPVSAPPPSDESSPLERILTLEEFGQFDDFDGSFLDRIRELKSEMRDPVAKDTVFGSKIWKAKLDICNVYLIERKEDPCPYKMCTRSSTVTDKASTHYYIIIPDNLKKLLGRTETIEETFLKRPSHLISCVLHEDGCGHLLQVRGIGGGGRIKGTLLMNLLFKLINSLKVKEVSLSDDSTLGEYNFKILYGLKKGVNWFSKWGFKPVEDNAVGYQEALNTLKGLKIKDLGSNLEKCMELVKNKLEFGSNWKGTNSLKELAQLYQSPNSSPVQKIDTKIVDLFDMMKLEPSNSLQEFLNSSSSKLHLLVNEALQFLKTFNGGARKSDLTTHLRAVMDGESEEGVMGLVEYTLTHIPNMVVGDDLIRFKEGVDGGSYEVVKTDAINTYQWDTVDFVYKMITIFEDLELGGVEDVDAVKISKAIEIVKETKLFFFEVVDQ